MAETRTAAERAAKRQGATPGKKRPEPERKDAGPGGALWHRLATSAGPLQAKLTVNTPGDAHEREADRVAEQVMRMPDPAAPGVSAAAPAIQRTGSTGEEEQVQRALPKEE